MVLIDVVDFPVNHDGFNHEVVFERFLFFQIHEVTPNNKHLYEELHKYKNHVRGLINRDGDRGVYFIKNVNLRNDGYYVFPC